MAQSIRISEKLYELARQEAVLMSRSLAQQLEHWAKLGAALEKNGTLNLDDVRSASASFEQTAQAMEVASGKRDARSLHVVPKALARKMRVAVKPVTFEGDQKTW